MKLSRVFYQDPRIELIWGVCIRRDIQSNVLSELCIIAFHYDDPLSLSQTSSYPFYRLPIASRTSRRWKGWEYRMTSHLSDVYHNSASGIISIDKRQQKGETRNSRRSSLFDSHFDLRVAQLLVLRQKYRAERPRSCSAGWKKK